MRKTALHTLGVAALAGSFSLRSPVRAEPQELVRSPVRAEPQEQVRRAERPEPHEQVRRAESPEPHEQVRRAERPEPHEQVRRAERPEPQALEPPAPPPLPASPATGAAPPPETPAEEAVAKVTEVLSTVVFRPAAWFDRLFGDERFVPPPAERGLGLVALGAAWSRVDGFRAPARIRVDYPFPILRERFSAVLSGGDEDEIDSDRDGPIRQAARARLGLRDAAYLAGLGYVPLEGKRSRLQLRAGARLGSTPEGLVQARYRFQTAFGDGYGVRFAETVFYRTARGPGATTLLDVDKALGARTLVRLTLEGTHYLRERGLDWGTGLTVYRRVGAEAAASLTAATEGSRGGPVSPRTVGARGSYRWPLIRNRLIIDVSAGLARAKREPGGPWILSPSAGLALELTFTESTATARP